MFHLDCTESVNGQVCFVLENEKLSGISG